MSYADRIRQTAKKALEARAAYERDLYTLDNPEADWPPLTPAERHRTLASYENRARDAIAAARHEAQLLLADATRQIGRPATADAETRRAVREALRDGAGPADVLARAKAAKRPDLLAALRSEMDVADFSGASHEAMADALGATGGSNPRTDLLLAIRSAEAELGDADAALEAELLAATTTADAMFARAERLDGDTLRDVVAEQVETGEAPWQPPATWLDSPAGANAGAE